MRQELAGCWVEVTTAGGAGLDPERSRILAVHGGVGLEDFYGRLGWTVTGRWPAKLRLSPGDTRDEVLMILAPL